MAYGKRYIETLNTAFLQLHNLQGLLGKLEEGTYSLKAGVTYQQYLVLIVVEAGGPPVTETLIAKRLQRNLNTISMIVDRMEKKGLLVRRWSEVDRRQRQVELTKKGKDALNKGLKVGVELRKRLGQEFTENELKELTALVTKLRDRVFKELGQEVPPTPVGNAIRQQVMRLYEKASTREKG